MSIKEQGLVHINKSTQDHDITDVYIESMHNGRPRNIDAAQDSHREFMEKIYDYEQREAMWPDWFWRPLLVCVTILMFTAFAYLLYWQNEISRGRHVAYRLPRQRSDMD